MKTITRSILLCSIALLLTLSPAPCRAVSPVEHDFDEMWRSTPRILEITNSNQTGTVARDGVTYTCSSDAMFFLSEKTASELAIFLVASGAQVEVSQIQNLDSICITFTPIWKDTADVFDLEILEEGAKEWKKISTNYQTSTLRTLKLPKVSNYDLRITKKSTNVYIKEIDYYCLDPLSACPNCFIYRPE